MKTEKTAVVTGSTGGIGLEISKLLAANGWNLVLLNRSREKTEKQISGLKQSFPEQAFYSYTADMMDLSDLGRAVEEIGAEHKELRALYNVAGILTDKRMTSAQGIEGHFAVNTLAPYFITQRLRSQLSAGASASQKSVVVNFSSSAIKSVRKLEVPALIDPEEIGGLMGAYAKSKLAITMVAEFLREDLFNEGILIYSVDPGPTKTPMTGSSDGMPWFIRILQPFVFKPADYQAERLVSAVDAGVSESISGVFLSEGKRKDIPSIVSDKELQSTLRTLIDSQVAEFL